MGNSLIGFTLLCLVVNLGVMFNASFAKIINYVKYYKSKWRKFIHAEEIAKKRND